jgi:spectrin beta
VLILLILLQTPLNVTDCLSDQQSTSSAVDVRCSQVDIADNYTKKKHVLRLNTLSGSELLLQAEDADNMVHWIHALQAQANEKEV